MSSVGTNYAEKWDGMKVKYLVLEDDDKFIVCIDEDVDVDWMTGAGFPGHKDQKAFNDVLNRMALLESQPTHDLDAKIRLSFKRMLGEAVARGLTGDYANAGKILDKAQAFVSARKEELARSWYLATGAFVTAAVLAVGLGSWLGRDSIRQAVGDIVFWLTISAVAGAAGAFLSIIMRMGKAAVDSSAGKTLHQLECLSRIVAGMLSAVLVGLAVYAEVIFPIFRKSANPYAFLVFVSVVAGASERLAPSLIETFEKQGLRTRGKQPQSEKSDLLPDVQAVE